MRKKIRRYRILTMIEICIALLAVTAAVIYGFATKEEMKKVRAERETAESTEVPNETAIASAESSTETAASETSETASGTAASTEAESSSDTAAESSEETVTETETQAAQKVIHYDQAVFVGDSRTLTLASGGTYEFRLVPDDSVCATWGGQLIDASAMENTMNAAAKQRAKAVFWYGINDVQLNPERDNEAVFIANYDKLISAYTAAAPGSAVYIVSILNTTVNEKDHYEGQEENVAKYNSALKAYCSERGYTYLDISWLFTDDCFEAGDNIHFSKNWYEWNFIPVITEAIGIVTEE